MRRGQHSCHFRCSSPPRGIRLPASSLISLSVYTECVQHTQLCCMDERILGSEAFPSELKHTSSEAWTFSFSYVQARYLNMGLVAVCIFRHPDTSKLVVTGRLFYWKSRGHCPFESFYSCSKVRFRLSVTKMLFANVVSVFLLLYKSTCLAWTECLNNKQLKDSLIASFWVFPLWSTRGHMASALTLRTCFLEAFFTMLTSLTF